MKDHHKEIKSGLGLKLSASRFKGIALSFSPLVSSVQLLSRVRLSGTPWTAACQASLSITDSHSLLKLMSISSLPTHGFLCG